MSSRMCRRSCSCLYSRNSCSRCILRPSCSLSCSLTGMMSSWYRTAIRWACHQLSRSCCCLCMCVFAGCCCRPTMDCMTTEACMRSRMFRRSCSLCNQKRCNHCTGHLNCKKSCSLRSRMWMSSRMCRRSCSCLSSRNSCSRCILRPSCSLSCSLTGMTSPNPTMSLNQKSPNPTMSLYLNWNWYLY